MGLELHAVASGVHGKMVSVFQISPSAFGVQPLPVLPTGTVCFGVGEVYTVLEKQKVDSQPLSVHGVRMRVWEGGPWVTVCVAQACGETFRICVVNHSWNQ